jgi:prepilin-type N-terminal cleavage/methylation domain-containing protein
MKSTQDGFTLIELLMVILVIAILAVIGITQFVNYGKDSRDAATKSNLQILRRAIAEKNGMMRVRCGAENVTYPPVANINSNDITGNSTINAAAGTAGQSVTAEQPCTSTTDVPVTADRLFVSVGIPVNPWSANIHTLSDPNNNAVWDCGGSCTRGNNTNPGGQCTTNWGNGWCYFPATGEVWPNSSRNDGKESTTGNEYLF